MRVQVVTTITTTIDLDTMTTDHQVVIEPDDGLPDSVASSVALGAARSIVARLDGSTEFSG